MNDSGLQSKDQLKSAPSAILLQVCTTEDRDCRGCNDRDKGCEDGEGCLLDLDKDWLVSGKLCSEGC